MKLITSVKVLTLIFASLILTEEIVGRNAVRRMVDEDDDGHPGQPQIYEKEGTLPDGTHFKTGGFFDPKTGTRGSYSSSSYNQEWHSP